MDNANIDDLIEDLVEREGGYVNHPADRGGPTNWGITEAVARRQGYVGDMNAMPQSDAAAIYKRLYWLSLPRRKPPIRGPAARVLRSYM